MSELPDQEAEFLRRLQGAPADDAPRAAHRNALREQALAEFERAARTGTFRRRLQHTFHYGRELMRRPVPRFIAATTACLVIAAFWLLVPGQQPAAHAFNRFASALVTAKTARFKMKISIEGQPKKSAQAYYLAPGKFRQELDKDIVGPEIVNLGDFANPKDPQMMMLMPSAKMAMVTKFQGRPKAADKKNWSALYDYFERLRELLAQKQDAKPGEYERLGEKEIGGKQAIGFRLDSPTATVDLWGDPATGTPVRIDTVWSGIPRTEVTMTDFQINPQLQESLFDMTVPEGYRVQTFEVDASQPGEGDLVKSLKAASEIGGGLFSDSLDTVGVQKLIIKYALGLSGRTKEKKIGISEEQTQKVMKQAVALGRGFQFALDLPESAAAHYAGKGIKQDTPDRPIFWYKPEGSAKFHVIYADLTVKETDAAPQVEGAVRIKKASQTTPPAAK